MTQDNKVASASIDESALLRYVTQWEESKPGDTARNAFRDMAAFINSHCAQQVAGWKAEAERHKEANQILLSKFFDMANERDLRAQLAARIEPAEKVDPSFYVIVDHEGYPEFVTKYRQASQEHINDACEQGVEGAVAWKAVPVYLAAQQPIAQPAPSIPDDWQWVPKYPTTAMMDGAFDNISLSDAHTEYCVTEHVWAHMLASAPKQNDGGE